MYHPTTLTTFAEERQGDMLRYAENTHRAEQATGPGTFPGRWLVAHPRVATAAVALLVVFGIVIA
jgi:hypothetical protein